MDMRIRLCVQDVRGCPTFMDIMKHSRPMRCFSALFSASVDFGATCPITNISKHFQCGLLSYTW